jgi:transcriptional regulator with XRE-family HTH domain
LGDAASYLRERFGLSQRAAARELGISHIHLNNIENGKVSPTASMIEKFYDAWGVDLYMLAVAKFSSKERIPARLSKAVGALASAWDREIEAVLARRRMESIEECSESSV